MDVQSLTLAGFAALGIVNVITMWKPNLTNKVKFILSFFAAFAVLFIPADLGNMLLDKVRLAVEVAFAASGVYKVATKAGGN